MSLPSSLFPFLSASFPSYHTPPHATLAHFSHRHLAYMLESHFSRAEKTWFNSLSSTVSTVDYLASRGIDFSSSRSTIWDARRGRTVLRI